MAHYTINNIILLLLTCKSNAEEGREERGVGEVFAKQENQDSPWSRPLLLLPLLVVGGVQGFRFQGERRVQPIRTGHRCPTEDTEGTEQGKSLEEGFVKTTILSPFLFPTNLF